MSRNKRRRKSTSWSARQITYPLDHTADSYGEPLDFAESASLPEFGEAFSRPTVRPLIRTVLVERPPFQSPPRRGKRQSPLVQVRATIRSSDKAIRSPFGNATMITPELATRAIVCAKRNIRREVLFATKSTGKGAKAPRKNRSKVRC